VQEKRRFCRLNYTAYLDGKYSGVVLKSYTRRHDKRAAGDGKPVDSNCNLVFAAVVQTAVVASDGVRCDVSVTSECQ
jgi:hypothetical protein